MNENLDTCVDNAHISWDTAIVVRAIWHAPSCEPTGASLHVAICFWQPGHAAVIDSYACSEITGWPIFALE